MVRREGEMNWMMRRLLLVVPGVLLAPSCSGAEAEDAGAGSPAPPAGEDSTDKRLFALGQLLDFDNAFVPAAEDECPEGCVGNQPPVLGEPFLEVNGRLVPALERVRQGDVVRILIPYDDPDCNLACGTASNGIESPEEGGEGGCSLPANLPCASEPDEVYLGFRFVIQGRGRYSFWGRLTDVCGERSEGFSGEFLAE